MPEREEPSEQPCHENLTSSLISAKATTVAKLELDARANPTVIPAATGSMESLFELSARAVATQISVLASSQGTLELDARAVGTICPPISGTNVDTFRNGWYAAGLRTAAAPMTGFIVKDRLYAIPFLGGTFGTTIDSIGIHVVVPQAGAHARLGIYAVTSTTDLYPAAKVSSGDLEIDVSVSGVRSIACSYAFAADTLYYLVATQSNSSVTWKCFTANNVYILLGINGTGGGRIASWAWEVTRGYTTLPDPFPGSASIVPPTSNDSPLIAVHVI